MDLDKKWEWLMTEVASCTNANANSVAASIISQSARTGHPTTSIIAKLLLMLKGKDQELELQRRELVEITKSHEAEKNKWVQLVFQLGSSAQSNMAAEPIPTSPDPLPPAELPSPANTLLSVPPRTRAKSPKREIQLLVNANSNDLSFEEVDQPSREEFPQVVNFLKVSNTNMSTATTTFMCITCRTVVSSSRGCNNQRSFIGHLNKCSGLKSENGNNEVENMDDVFEEKEDEKNEDETNQ